jgi:hypothetical protein
VGRCLFHQVTEFKDLLLLHQALLFQKFTQGARTNTQAYTHNLKKKQQQYIHSVNAKQGEETV